MDTIHDVIVVGGGAAGLIAAGRAGEMGGKVLLLEKMERVGRKLLLTGKGRCNITNDAPRDEFLKHIHPNSRFLRHAFATYFADDIIRLLNNHGCATVVERGGRVFPVSNKASDVVDALVAWVTENRVEIRCSHRVDSLVVDDGAVTGLLVHAAGGCQKLHARSVILCTGGKSYPATGSDGDGYRMASRVGHAIETPRQALVPLETDGDAASRMQGLALKNVTASAWVNGKKAKQEFGELLMTEFGLAGPIILTLSRFVVAELQQDNKVEIAIDLKPALDEPTLDNRLIRDLKEFGKSPMCDIVRKWLPAAMVPVMLDLANVDGRKPGHQLTAKERRKILLLMKDFRFRITGCRSFKEAIITAGGVVTSQIDAKSMASKLVANLFFAGELIDVDADTGGFNLQIAFSTAWLAAEAAMSKAGSVMD